MATSVNFTIRRPTPVDSRADSSGPESESGSSRPTLSALPRHLTDSTPLGSPLARSDASTPIIDSSDEDSAVEDELVTGFDKFGVQRLNEDKKPKNQGPLVIPALKNKDWRAAARKRRNPNYVPPPAAQTGADGSVGGLGTVETIGTEPAMSGLYVRKKETVTADENAMVVEEEKETTVQAQKELTEDERALQALLAEVNGDSSRPLLSIPQAVSEAEALKQDVDELPDVATLEDYERVPVEEFGAALLRGMGWKEGPATKKGGKNADPFLPPLRPAFLGLGAKEQDILDDGSKRKKKGKTPLLVKPLVPIRREDSSGKAKDRSRSPRRSTHSSRRNSRSPDRHSGRDREDGRRHKDDGYNKDRRSEDSEKDRRRRDDRDRRDDGRRSDDRDKRRRDDREDDKDRKRRDVDDRDHRRDSTRRRDY